MRSYLTRMTVILFALATFNSCAFTTTATMKTSTLKVGIIGDQTGAPSLKDLTGPYATLQKGISILNKQDIDVVIHVGDMVESTLDETVIRKDFAKVSEILKSLKTNWFLSVGDHDVNPTTYVQNSTDASKKTLFKSLYSNINPLVSDNLYYSFDVGAYHFISLYSEEHLHTDPRWGNVFFAGLSDIQYRWLEADLKANSTKAGIIVFVHQPIWYNWSNWIKIHELISAYPVIAVVAGHFHYNQFEGVLDNIQYWVVGATGAKTKTGSQNAGNLQHVTVMTLVDKRADFNLISVEDESIVKHSTRYNMDRIQAIDQTLLNLWNTASYNPVYLKGNSLVSDCESAEPATLKIRSIGNPTELPVVLKISIISDVVTTTSSSFTKGLCLPDPFPTQFECVLPPTQWISMANTALTQLAYDKQGQNLWKASLDLTGTTPISSQAIVVRILMEMQAPKGNPYSIYKDVSIPLKTCPSD